MRKCVALFSLICILLMLTVSAGATAAKSVSAHATVSHDGTCQMTLTATIHLDQVTEDLRFPLPEKSANVTVNGARARSHIENGLRQVNLNSVIGKAVGDFTLNFTYTLPNLIVTNEAGLLELRLPILSGFAYPVQALEFSVTLPGAVTAAIGPTRQNQPSCTSVIRSAKTSICTPIPMMLICRNTPVHSAYSRCAPS